MKLFIDTILAAPSYGEQLKKILVRRHLRNLTLIMLIGINETIQGKILGMLWVVLLQCHLVISLRTNIR